MGNNPTLAQGRDYLAIPGPSVVPDVVLQAMHRASSNIYGGALVDMTHTIIPDLKQVACTRHNVAIYICNGHGTWEAALSNVIAPGDKVLVPCTGAFGIGWGEVARTLGAEVDIIDFGTSSPMDMARIGSALAGDKHHAIKAVLGVHVDTSSSVRNDIAALRAVMDQTGHPALLMADCIASMGCDRFEMDAWGVDVALTASQKGLMMPPGLGFVFFNNKAAGVRDAMPRVSRYWDWKPRADPEVFYQYFAGTAPVQMLYGLRAALDLILEEGMHHVWSRHQRLARSVWSACAAWGRKGSLSLNVGDPAWRSHAVTALNIDPPLATALREWTEVNLGLTLGISLGMAPPGDRAWHGHFRLGHMGHVNGHMVLGMLGGIEAGLTALDIPHGAGALEVAAAVIAGA